MNKDEFEKLHREAEAKLRSEKLDRQPYPKEDIMELFHELDVYRTELEMQNDELRKTQTELEASRLRYADLYDFAPVAYLTLDDKGVVLEANLTAATQLGVERKNLVGKPFALFLEGAGRDEHHRYLKGIFSGKGAVSCELRIKPKKEEPFYAELDSSLFTSVSGETSCRTAIINIDDRKAAERLLLLAKESLALKVAERTRELEEKNEALQHATNAADAASRAKSDFLANMSHEIRSPMQTIILMIDMLSEIAMTAEQEEYLAILKRAGDNLISLISDILDISKIEAGRIALEEIDFDLIAMLEKTVKSFEAGAERKRLKLTRHVSSDLPSRVVGDPTRLCQILTNLISNAIKFTSEGEVSISVERGGTPGKKRGRSEKRVDLLFTVRDTGTGIPEDKIDQIFNQFSQADSSITRKFGGAGLGTAICKGLVERMGGRIWIECEEERGCAFCFSLPFGLLPEAKESAAKTEKKKGLKKGEKREAPPSEGMPPLKILLVEDSEDIRNLIARLLAKTTMTLRMAEDGSEGLKEFKSGSYDLVVMDIQMPVMDGLTAARQMREWEEEKGAKKTPLIALTAHAFREDEEKCLNAGFNTYLAKPVGKKHFFETLSRYAPK